MGMGKDFTIYALKVRLGHVPARASCFRQWYIPARGAVQHAARDLALRAQPGYVKFWWHAMRRKYFVEVVRSPPLPAELGEALADEADEGTGTARAGSASPRSRVHPVVARRRRGEQVAVDKYPLVRVQKWELPSLLRLPADTAASPAVVSRLRDWILALNHVQRAALVPRGVPLIGGVEREAWGAAHVEATSNSAGDTTPDARIAGPTTTA